MQILSLNIGRACPLEVDGRRILSAIGKRSVAGPVAVQFGGSLAPGDAAAPGTLTANNTVTLASGSILSSACSSSRRNTEAKPDGIQRDGPEVRARFDARLRAALQKHGLPWVSVQGPEGDRLATALAAIQALQRPSSK